MKCGLCAMLLSGGLPLQILPPSTATAQTVRPAEDGWKNDPVTLRISNETLGNVLSKVAKSVGDKFYMEDKSRTISGSNGLGLYITKEIVDDLSGVIEVKSKKEKGSRFVVRIPIEEGKIRRTITEAFDALPHNVKTFLYLFFGGILCSLYRFQKFYETRHRATLIAGILLMPLFLLGWAADFFSLVVCDRITLVAD